MKSNEVLSPDHKAVGYFINIPRKLLQFHDADHLAEYVLYDLSRDHCFNFNKAAYFVDNPDFDCMKGIAGYEKRESCALPADYWHSPDTLAPGLQQSTFNSRVRTLTRASHKRGSYADEHLVREVAHELGIEKPELCLWNMKHNNHGVLMYEYADANAAASAECVAKGSCLLGFCPIV